MPRKGPAPKRPLVVDPVYGSPVVTQLVNRVLLDGKKSTAERIVYGALEGVRAKTDQDPVSVLKRALDNIRPALEVRSRRVGGATYQVPVEVRPNRATTLAPDGRVQQGLRALPLVIIRASVGDPRPDPDRPRPTPSSSHHRHEGLH